MEDISFCFILVRQYSLVCIVDGGHVLLSVDVRQGVVSLSPFHVIQVSTMDEWFDLEGRPCSSAFELHLVLVSKNKS